MRRPLSLTRPGRCSLTNLRQLSSTEKDRIRTLTPVLATAWQLSPLSTPVPDKDDTASLDRVTQLLCIVCSFSSQHIRPARGALQAFLGISPDDFLAAYFRINGSHGVPQASLKQLFQLLVAAIQFDVQCDPQKPLMGLWKAKVSDFLQQNPRGSAVPLLSSLGVGEREMKEAEAYWHIALERDATCAAPNCRRYWGPRGEPLLLCSRCRTYYCSAACQKSCVIRLRCLYPQRLSVFLSGRPDIGKHTKKIACARKSERSLRHQALKLSFFMD